jgi:hypothetical protein
MQRYRLGEQKGNAIKTSNFLEAHRVQEIIEGLVKEEQELKQKLDRPATPIQAVPSGSRSNSIVLDPAVPGPSGVSESRRVDGASLISEHSKADEEASSTPSRPRGSVDLREEDMPLSQANTTLTQNQVVISHQNMLQGFVMLAEYLSLVPKVTPFVRQLYLAHLAHCLVVNCVTVQL